MKKSGVRARTQYGQSIIGALHEAIAIERGVAQPAGVRQVVTARSAAAPPAPQYSAGDVKEIRYKLELSQPVFAQVLNVSPETVRAWEQGKKQPGGPAARLLEIADQHPDWILTAVEVR